MISVTNNLTNSNNKEVQIDAMVEMTRNILFCCTTSNSQNFKIESFLNLLLLPIKIICRGSECFLKEMDYISLRVKGKVIHLYFIQI